MDSRGFDALTRRLGAAGSRRRVLSTLLAGAFAGVLGGATTDEAAAGCKGYKGKCKSKGSCCSKEGLRCKRGKCRCKNGWRHCPGTGEGCTHVKADPEHCGACGNQCPAETPCCINGSCQELCGDTCCANCFVELLFGGIPKPNSDMCCSSDGANLCSANKHDKEDDFCCWPDQECVKGECCGALQGSVVCGGKCCAGESCCNGKCCPDGQVCGEMTPGVLTCVAANRACDNPDGCAANEECIDDICCSEDRSCGEEGCCAIGEYCDKSLDENWFCCERNTYCGSTYRGHRVRR
jgi:hypothetical protein